MSRKFMYHVFVWLAVLACFAGRAMALYPTATITVNGSEQSGDTNTITVAFNGFTETLHYGQASTPASVASAIAGMFSRDYLQTGLCASVTTVGGSTVLFKLRTGASFASLNVTGSTTSFQLASSGFGSSGGGGTVYDAGTVQLILNMNDGNPAHDNIVAASTSYGSSATPASIAAGLAAGVASGSPVNLSNSGSSVNIVANATGDNTNSYNYVLQTSYDTAHFTQPSFQGSPDAGNLSGGASVNSNGGTIYSYSIPSYGSSGAAGYDAVGNVTGYTDSVMGTWTNIAYDSLNRLTGAVGPPLPGQSTATNYCWGYDSFGNRAMQNAQTGTCSAQSASTWVYNANNQVSGVIPPGGTQPSPSPLTYDAAGDVTADTGSLNRYAYDGEGRICAVASPIGSGGAQLTGYIYNADGVRVSKGVIQAVVVNGQPTLSCDLTQNGFQAQTDYVIGANGESVTDLAVSGGTATPSHTYIYQGGTLMATFNFQDTSSTNPNGLYFRLTDWLGTLRVTTDHLGTYAGSEASLPFGDMTVSLGNIPDPHAFTGKERDTESGNDYFGARYYASSMGRFMSPDWSAKVMPVPYAKLDNPQSLNLYAYVGNNPLTRFDPDGHTVPSSCASDSKCSITVKVNVILDKNAKLTKADWKAFQKDFLGKAQKDFGNSNIKLDYTYTNGSLKDDGSTGTGMKSGYLNFFVTDKNFGGPDGGSKTSPAGLAESYIDIKGLGEGGGPNSTNWTSVIIPVLADSNVFEHELGQQFLGTQSSPVGAQDLMRQDKIDNENTFQGWGLSSNPYRTGLEPASFSAPTNPQQ